MRARTLYFIGIVISLFVIVIVGYNIYETNFVNDKKIYQAIIVGKCIYKDTDGGAWAFKFKFKWENDTVIVEDAVSQEDYNISKLNDTVNIYYIPKALGNRIIIVDYLNYDNKGSIIFTSFLVFFIIWLVYKIRTTDKDVMIESAE
jgi:hypothetical protein